jgi:hypothetical protein
MTWMNAPERSMVEITLWNVFPEMRDVTLRVHALTDPQVDHIARLFHRTENATTYVAEEVLSAYDDIIKWRV